MDDYFSTLSASTRHNHKYALKCYFTSVYNDKFDKEFSLIKISYKKGGKKGRKKKSGKKEKDILSKEEYELLRKVLPNPKFKLMYDMLRGSGLRIQA